MFGRTTANPPLSLALLPDTCDLREERLRLRHGRAGGLAMPPPPPPPPSQGAIDASPNVTKDVASLHSGVVGVGVATRDPVSSRGVPTGASVARQTEVRMEGSTEGGAGERNKGTGRWLLACVGIVDHAADVDADAASAVGCRFLMFGLHFPVSVTRDFD